MFCNHSTAQKDAKFLCINKKTETVCSSCILFCFSLFFIYLTASQKILLYVHTRHIPAVLSAAVLFFVIACIQIIEVKKNYAAEMQLISFPFYLTVFVFPLVLFLVFPPKPLSSDSISYNTGSVYADTNQANQFPQKESCFLELQNGKIIMNDDTFGKWLPELYLNLDTWVDSKIEIEGAVWKNSDMLTAKEFAIGRMMMVCCAADMQPVGIMIRWDNAQSLKDNDWVRVTGSISKIEYEGNYEPIVIAEAAEQIKRPVHEYVYPF